MKNEAKYCCTEYSPFWSFGLKDPALPGDVGHNLTQCEDVVIPAQGFRRIRTGIHVEFPDEQWGLILARSSANSTGKLICLPGVIDQGYRGELTAMVHNVAHRTWRDPFANLLHKISFGWLGWAGSENDYDMSMGKALTQLVFFPIVVPTTVRVKDETYFSTETVRGHNGWGHTGG